MKKTSVVALLFAGTLSAPASAEFSDALLAGLRQGGYIIYMRHGPTNKAEQPKEQALLKAGEFRLDDCSTQRKLSAEGREEARRIGEAFASRGIPVGEVLSSQWCRCLETARLAFGKAQPWTALNSNLNDSARAPEEKNREARARLSDKPASGNLILVTHNFNIRDLTGLTTTQGEMVIVAPEGAGRFTVVGKLKPF